MNFIDDVPPRGGNRRGWRRPEDREVVDGLKRQEGKWLKWPREFDRPVQAYQYAHSLKARFPGLESRARTIDGQPVVFARWPVHNR